MTKIRKEFAESQKGSFVFWFLIWEWGAILVLPFWASKMVAKKVFFEKVLMDVWIPDVGALRFRLEDDSNLDPESSSG